MEPLDESRRPAPEFGRQGGHDLELRRRDDRAQAELGGRAGQPREEQGLGLVGGHPGQSRPVAVHEADAAMGPAVRIDRDTGGAQGIHVAMDAPDGDLQLARELGRRQPAPRLEQEQQRHEA